MKNHKIETFTDIVNATNPENIDNFLIDLYGIMQQIFKMREIKERKGLSDDEFILPTFMDWMDDGEHNITVTLNEIPPKNETK